jgi:integrase
MASLQKIGDRMVSSSEAKPGPVHLVGKRGRERGQNGYLDVVGKKVKRWRGHYVIYESREGTEFRKHKAVIIGLRSQLTRKQAADALRGIIAQKLAVAIERQPEMTFGQFWRERYLPLYQQKWKSSSRKTQVDNIERYCVKPLEDKLLKELDRFSLQMRANHLAQRFSKSVVTKYVIWCRAILEEALDQDLIPKNPAKKLMVPETKPENKRFLELAEIAVVLAKLPFRERLVLRMSLILGLRPGELFALRWNDVDGHSLRLDEETVDGKLFPTLKTKKSRAFLALPASLRVGLTEWREIQNPESEDDFIFPNSEGGVHRVDNYRADILRPILNEIAKETGISGIDFRACRRTCATHLSQHGGIKEVQAHLRHARATTTLDVYIQEIPRAVREAVESLDAAVANPKGIEEKSKKESEN